MKNTTRKISLKLLALLLASLAALAASACAKKVDSPKLEHSVMQFYCPNDGMTSLFLDGKKLDDQIGGAITKIGTVDGTKGFVTAATALYRFDETGLLKIYPAAVTNAVLSLDERFILFASSTEVFLYDHDKKSYDKIPDTDCKSVVGLVLSPDGSAAGITVVDANDRINAYTYIDGKTSLYGSDRCIAAIGNGGKTSYCLAAPNGEVSGELYYVNGGKEIRIAENASNYFEVNRDLSEITFDIDSRTYISRNGGEAKKLVEDSVLSYSGAQKAEQGGRAVVTLLKNTNTLLDSVFYSEVTGEHEDGYTVNAYNIYYVDSSLNVSTLARGASQFSVSDDGTAILCTVDEVLYRVSAHNPKKPEQLAKDVFSFCCTPDLKTVYPISTGGNLWRIENGTSSPILLLGIQLAKLMDNGVAVCYAPMDGGGTLIWMQNGTWGTIRENVSFFEVYPGMAALLSDHDEANNTYDLYISTDGINFSLAEEDVRIGR
ncbi:MAG: hypothetical protein IJM20_05710 [Clostridia bacterium]|nr:hypothetical protein [Clostridia bacterium]